VSFGLRIDAHESEIFRQHGQRHPLSGRFLEKIGDDPEIGGDVIPRTHLQTGYSHPDTPD
jgi:hypothetical protein